MFEFGVRSAFNQTIKRGNPRDLKAMLELLDEHGAMSVVDQRAEAEAGANQAIEKIMNYAFRMEGIDPEDAAQIKQHEQQEASLVMACSHCAPALRELWRESGRRRWPNVTGRRGSMIRLPTRTRRKGQRETNRGDVAICRVGSGVPP